MFYEDFKIGEEYTTEAFSFSTEQIIAFAQTYDPQPFHMDEAVAQNSIYGGLIASGWHVFTTAFGAVVRLGLFQGGGQGAGGFDDARWHHPVRPGDTLRCTIKITHKRESKTRLDRGYVHMHFAITNQHGQVVAGFHGDQIFLKRASSM
jgi:acyl dehydratase